MKKVFLFITMSIAFIILIGEIEELTFGIIAMKIASLFYLWLVAKANNYFMRRNKTMLSDEEKKAIDLLKNIDKQKCMMLECPVVKNNIERQLKIIELNRTIRKQSKEIEELKETLKCTQNSWYEDTQKMEEIKRKYKNMLCISYEDIGNLIQMVEMLDKQIKRKDVTKNMKI